MMNLIFTVAIGVAVLLDFILLFIGKTNFPRVLEVMFTDSIAFTKIIFCVLSIGVASFLHKSQRILCSLGIVKREVGK